MSLLTINVYYNVIYIPWQIIFVAEQMRMAIRFWQGKETDGEGDLKPLSLGLIFEVKIDRPNFFFYSCFFRDVLFYFFLLQSRNFYPSHPILQ